MKNIFQLILLISILVSCSSEPSVTSGYYHQDFENLRVWGAESCFATLDKSIAHSGVYSSKIGENADFSYGFDMPLSELKDKGYTKMKVEAFGMIGDKESDAQLVLSVEGSEKSIAWMGKPFKEVMRGLNEWSKVDCELNFPNDTSSNLRVKVYAWTQNKKNAWIDDISITFSK